MQFQERIIACDWPFEQRHQPDQLKECGSSDSLTNSLCCLVYGCVWQRYETISQVRAALQRPQCAGQRMARSLWFMGQQGRQNEREED